jgi:hypothetical protein
MKYATATLALVLAFFLGATTATQLLLNAGCHP